MSLSLGLFTGLFDDAAIFPPGDLPLDRAVPAHLAHRQAGYGDLVGRFVVGAAALDELAGVVAPLRPGSLDIALTASAPELAQALQAASAIAAVRVVAVEVTVPEGLSASEAVDLVGRRADDARTFVELPRGARRGTLLAALGWAGLAAKLRTGGLVAHLHPDEEELAAAIVATVRAAVPFKATAGLHHAVRNTDPATGFEQHGFLNLLLATAAARAGADVPAVARLLTERDAARVVAGVREVDVSVRASFRSFGTCSIVEPVDELEALGLAVPA
jgi:hypothetical protein